MHRGIFQEALTWLEIHGNAPDVVEHWRGFIEAPGRSRASRSRSNHSLVGAAEGGGRDDAGATGRGDRKDTDALSVLPFELAHELQRARRCLFGKCVIDRRPHAAYGSMSFESVESCCRGLLLEESFRAVRRVAGT